MDKSHHSSSGIFYENSFYVILLFDMLLTLLFILGSGDGVTGMTSMTLPRPPPPRDSCEYETAMPGGGSIHSQPPTGSLDKRHYVPTYVGSYISQIDNSFLFRNTSMHHFTFKSFHLITLIYINVI